MKTSKPTSRHGKEIVPESLPETALVTCPYCGETEELFVDAGGGEHGRAEGGDREDSFLCVGEFHFVLSLSPRSVLFPGVEGIVRHGP